MELKEVQLHHFPYIAAYVCDLTWTL